MGSRRSRDTRVLCCWFYLAVGNFHAFSTWVNIPYYEEHPPQPSPLNPSIVCQIHRWCAWSTYKQYVPCVEELLPEISLHCLLCSFFWAVLKNQSNAYSIASIHQNLRSGYSTFKYLRQEAISATHVPSGQHTKSPRHWSLFLHTVTSGGLKCRQVWQQT